MKKNILLLTFVLLAGQSSQAQSLTTVTGKNLYEHHSKDIAGPQGQPNGSEAGYDFVNNTYVSSFDASTFNAYADGTDTTIDMVEHNGPYGNGKDFGFTSGVSSIWGGDIKGNGTTKWMQAPGSFNYTTATTVSEIEAAYNAAMATVDIAKATENTVYLARIRNSQLYVAMRTYNVTNKQNGNTFFDFDYKYGTLTTGIGDVAAGDAVLMYPNPASDRVILKNLYAAEMNVRVVSIAGQEIQLLQLAANASATLHTGNLPAGMYLVDCTTADGGRILQRLAIQ